MALASTQACNAGLDALATAGLLAFVSLHIASTSTTGANEMASTTRQSCSWNAASGGTKTNSTSLSWSTPGTTAATHFGTFSAVTVGTFGIGLALASSVTATTITAAPGALTLNAS